MDKNTDNSLIISDYLPQQIKPLQGDAILVPHSLDPTFFLVEYYPYGWYPYYRKNNSLKIMAVKLLKNQV